MGVLIIGLILLLLFVGVIWGCYVAFGNLFPTRSFWTLRKFTDAELRRKGRL